VTPVGRIRQWWRGLAAGGVGATFDGTRGRPRSANGASSFHLVWLLPDRPWVEAEAVLEVVEAPSVPVLVFWAMQASFVDPTTAGGRRHGGGHLGLQWYPAHPGSTAVNWGGYGADGRELSGSPSSLPSATGNPNTRDLSWRPGRPYRLGIAPAPGPGGGWRGTVTDDVTGEGTTVRTLNAGGRHLDGLVVWSEVFAPCEVAAGTVRWRGLRLRAEDGGWVDVSRVRVHYQAVADGGCVTTDASVAGGGFEQRTGVVRRTAAGTVLSL
jgi:hypothetical protein